LARRRRDPVEWPWEVAERDHEIQNPTSADKIRLLGEYLRLDRESRVLDVACGKGGPALVLASTFGCRIVGIELRSAFADEARARTAARGLDSLVEVRTADAATVALEPDAWDAALCLGASFVWGSIGDAATALVPAVRRGGFVAIGEPFWRRWPPPDGVDDAGYVDLAGTCNRFVGAGVAITGLIAADEDDWDRYESLHWRALEEWLALHPGADDIRGGHERAREEYLRSGRALLGWAILVGRRR
jgi:SAM-dependent methyltransferase